MLQGHTWIHLVVHKVNINCLKADPDKNTDNVAFVKF